MAITSRPQCWNCGSTRYRETAAVESCPDCGIRCDYHGGGPNDKYRMAMAWQHAAEAAERQAELSRMEWEELGWPYPEPNL
jgi:predicted  nucleic acid-binding Zn-ribbon protein